MRRNQPQRSWEKITPGTGNRKCKGPEVEISWQGHAWLGRGQHAIRSGWGARSARAVSATGRGLD